MEPFTLATEDDYVDRYGGVPVEHQDRVAAYLARASRIVRDELAADGYDIEALIAAGTVRADTATDVVCDMVSYMIRSVSDGGFGPQFGSSQASMTAGPYTQSATFSTPAGSLSFTRVHRRRLGLAPVGAFEVDLLDSNEVAP
jgi:hypothetical protein